MSDFAGIYIHVPYCSKTCTYCDFYFSTKHDSIPETVKGILKELNLRKEELDGKKIQSIYFGGGTPSLLPSENIAEIISEIHEHFNTSHLKEVTIETNPDDITKEKLLDWHKIGINRLSIGLQSFNDNELKQMNRTHNAEMGRTAVKLAQEYGFTNITVDLIYGTPWKNTEEWKYDIDEVIKLNVQHVSAYQLTVETKTQLNKDIHTKKTIMTADEEVGHQFEILINKLEKAGIHAYEISNFAKPGFAAVHNTSYWQGLPYLGIGPSAHSYDGIKRKWNISNLHTWRKNMATHINWWQEEILTENEKYNELILTRLRTRNGLKETSLLQFSKKIQDYFNKQAKEAIAINNLTYQNGIYSIPKTAILLTDAICSNLFLV